MRSVVLVFMSSMSYIFLQQNQKMKMKSNVKQSSRIEMVNKLALGIIFFLLAGPYPVDLPSVNSCTRDIQ